MKTYVVASTKGGVGKSTTTINVARKLAMKYKVGVIDGDLTSPSILKILNAPLQKLKIGRDKIEPIEFDGIKIFSTALLTGNDDMPIFLRGERKRSAIEQFINKIEWGDIDYLLIDAAPGCSDELIEILNIFKKRIDGMVIVTTPSRLSVNSVRKLVSLCNKKNIKITGLISNMDGFKCSSCGLHTDIFGNQDGVSKIIQEFKIQLLDRVPIIPDVESRPMMIMEYFRWVNEVM
jgi:ATP-binding protein involved in chromosome partitioning